MTKDYYEYLYLKSLGSEPFAEADALDILTSKDIDLISLVAAAWKVRSRYYGKEVMVHILNNVQNGLCPEDCKYCAQSASSNASITEYPMKSEVEILEEARAAHEQGAFRYCMVFSGTGPSDERVTKLVGIIQEIKKRWPLEVCVSPGVVTREQARRLKEAGLDRLNHNLNTSPTHYAKICTTHTYEDRLKTLANAKEVGLRVCSGVIVGMGESPEEVVRMALALKDCSADSIPVNFFMPIPGTRIEDPTELTPEYCLRVLCLFRFLNPKAEIRMAAGREMHLRHLEPLGLYPANSLFLQGYLNARGSSNHKTLEMIRDLGFTIRSEIKIDDLLEQAETTVDDEGGLKDIDELRPFFR